MHIQKIMEKYNPTKIEKKWREKWLEENRWQADLEGAKKPYYNLMMFPYPSAEGLHVGNLYAFTGSDIHGRYMRMRGYDVFEPIGFDAFGIHSENFAIKKGLHPRELIKKSTGNFRKQLERAGHMYSWDNVVDTTDPGYYKWTQWLFLQLYKARLAYLKEAPVQWCPGCKTVLANEQVIAGKCERCDAVVESKRLKQWFFKITDYADRLLENLAKIDWSERTKTAQANWIGKSTGYRLKFKISNSEFQIEVFTTRPDTIFGVTYVVLAPDHHLVEKLKGNIENWDEVSKYAEAAKKKPQSEKIKEDREKTGVELKGVKAVNPANNEEIPVWVADYVLAEYGTGAIMAVPAHDERDMEFAKKYNLPISDAPLVDGEKIAEEVEGDKEAHYHLRDWLISRQRYWGPPIPVIFCTQCRKTQTATDRKTDSNEQFVEGVDWTYVDGEEYAIVPVPEEDLPVELPYVEDYKPKGTGKGPLAGVDEFVNTKCPQCGGEAVRETDVSDTFLDSSWYFLAYIGKENFKFEILNSKFRQRAKRWLPVDMYIGGQEHAVLHLMYARFITMVLHDQNLLDFEEPFEKFRAHGLLIREGAKISKSRGNTINPDEFFEAFGADTVRTYLMFLSPLVDGGDWQDEGIRGVHRFLSRVWGLVQKYEKGSPDKFEKVRHQTIKKVTEDIERLHYNTAIAALMSYLNELESGEPTEEDIRTLLVLLAPFAPYITEELWERMQFKDSVHDQNWPEYDEEKAKENKITIPVQINGKVRGEIEVEPETDKKELENMALEKIKDKLEGKEPKKVIVVPNKIVNIVV